MKRYVFPVLIVAALILPVLAGCPQDSGGGTPSGTLGNGELVLEGTVYRRTQDETTYEVTYTEYADPLEVEVMAQGGSSGGETLGEGSVTNGTFKISISNKPTNLGGIDGMGSLFGQYGWDNDNVTADATDARGAMISLREKGGARRNIGKDERNISGDETNGKFSMEQVVYLYVDKNVTITLESKESNYLMGAPTTAKAATLTLETGWNALFFKGEVTASGGSLSGTMSVSVGNPDLRWVIQ
jgi:hypothetical protein